MGVPKMVFFKFQLWCNPPPKEIYEWHLLSNLLTLLSIIVRKKVRKYNWKGSGGFWEYSCENEQFPKWLSKKKCPLCRKKMTQREGKVRRRKVGILSQFWINKRRQRVCWANFLRANILGVYIKVEDLKLNLYDFFTQILGFTSEHFGCAHKSKGSEIVFYDLFYTIIIFWYDFLHKCYLSLSKTEQLNIRRERKPLSGWLNLLYYTYFQTRGGNISHHYIKRLLT